MPLIYPTFEELANQIRAEFRRQLPEVDPTVFGSWARAFADGNAALAQAITYLVRDLEKQLFPQTATDEFLDLWGGYEDLPRNDESPSQGLVTVNGTIGTIIPVSTQFAGGNGINYTSQAVATIQNVVQSITSLTRSGSTVTAVLPADHNLATGIEVTISGFDQPEYNGLQIVEVNARNEFQYQITTTPVTPATGSGQYSADIASISVKSVENGIETNLEGGATLSFVTPIVGIPGSALAQFDGITGGASIESDELYRTRILLSRSIIEGVFTTDQVILASLSLSGNTRAFVKNPTLAGAGGALDPVPGQVSVFILRDNDPNILPSQSILDQTKQAIIEDGALPAHTSEADLFVESPTLVETDFDFTALNPDTSTMRDAVNQQLIAFFEDTAEFETNIPEASYLGAIQGTQDLVTGQFIVSFALSTPTGDIIVGPGQIAALGNVTFTI